MNAQFNCCTFSHLQPVEKHNYDFSPRGGARKLLNSLRFDVTCGMEARVRLHLAYQDPLRANLDTTFCAAFIHPSMSRMCKFFGERLGTGCNLGFFPFLASWDPPQQVSVPVGSLAALGSSQCSTPLGTAIAARSMRLTKLVKRPRLAFLGHDTTSACFSSASTSAPTQLSP